MKKIDDGGPAFPTLEQKTSYKHSEQGVDYMSLEGGMSLRDWFAGQALAGLAAIFHGTPSLADEAALRAYQTADAMIRARAPSQDGGNHE